MNYELFLNKNIALSFFCTMHKGLYITQYLGIGLKNTRIKLQKADFYWKFAIYYLDLLEVSAFHIVPAHKLHSIFAKQIQLDCEDKISLQSSVLESAH